MSTPDESVAGSPFRIALSGEIDIARETELAELRTAFLASSRPTAVVDLSQVTFIESTGLAFLVGIRDIARERHGTVILHDPSPTLLRVLQALALDHVFEVSHNGQGSTQLAT